MPKATVSSRTVTQELKSVEGGQVELRKLSYGEILERRELASSMAGKPAQGTDGDNEVIARVHHSAIQLFDFSRCIVDHNLEDDNGQKLNLSMLKGMSVLDPIVGQEIESMIDELNNPPEDEESKSGVGEASPTRSDLREEG